MASDNLYSYLKQRQALSGQAPTSNMVDSIVQGELSSAYDSALAEQAQKQKQDEFNQQIAQQEQARSTATATGIGQTAAQMGTMYGMSDSHALKDTATKGIDTVKNFLNPQVTPPAYTPAASQGVGSVASSTDLDTVAPTAVPTEAAIPTVSGASGFAPITADPSLVGAASQAAPTIGISAPSTGITPSAIGGSEIAPAATGTLATIGSNVGSAIGSGVGAITGSETAAATGASIGGSMGAGISAVTPYGLTLPLATGLHKGVDALFNINEDATGKTIGDIFDPLKGISDLFGF